jgi:diaminopimelate epimerase
MNESPASLTLTKHHGLGNDFLVCTAPTPPDPAWRADLARRYCDRRRGIGADGMLFLGGPAPADHQWVMELYNADGSRAEMSGNGIRCFVQALAMDLGADRGTFPVNTDAGLRIVEVTPTDDPNVIMASVSMGAAEPLSEPHGWHQLECDPLRPVSHLSMGNPHSIVAVEDVSAVDLARLGGLVPHVNLEIVEPGPERHGITMRVHERGAGITEACGTGAAAAASVAAAWGLAEPLNGEILVHMDGGDARVKVDGSELVLIGPSVFIARVEVPVRVPSEVAFS